MSKSGRMDNPNLHIGTSGWDYKPWRGVFYPAKLVTIPLAFYSQSFATVEINSSFYHLPTRQTVESWGKSVPSGFIFAVKVSRLITHLKKLKNVEKEAGQLLEHFGFLGRKLGPFLFQLPPYWKSDAERLRIFLGGLPTQQRYVFEFRHPSWYNIKIYRILEKYQAALCIHDHRDGASPQRLTTDLAYVRLHGPQGQYQGKYTEANLLAWAEKISGWMKDKIKVYAYFNNDQNGFAVENANRLSQLTKKQTVKP